MVPKLFISKRDDILFPNADVYSSVTEFIQFT
jgi:hypothetical protein